MKNQSINFQHVSNLLKKAWLVYNVFAFPVFANTGGVTIPSTPTISETTMPVVSYPSPVTLSSNDSFLPNAESSSKPKDTSTPSVTVKNENTLTSLAASALQQLIGTDDLSTTTLNSTGIENLLTGKLNNNTIDLLTNSTNRSLPTCQTTSSFQTQGRILRYLVNGNDRSESFKNYWISEPERTGAFLLTGSYAEENKTEVFYMYFIPKDSDNYTVSISTDNECNGFFSSLLSLQKPLTAQRTGNLVAMRTGDEAIHIDMLLSINFKTKK